MKSLEPYKFLCNHRFPLWIVPPNVVNSLSLLSYPGSLFLSTLTLSFLDLYLSRTNDLAYSNQYVKCDSLLSLLARWCWVTSHCCNATLQKEQLQMNPPANCVPYAENFFKLPKKSHARGCPKDGAQNEHSRRTFKCKRTCTSSLGHSRSVSTTDGKRESETLKRVAKLPCALEPPRLHCKTFAYYYS